jgi:hypothetical protein
VRIDHMPGKDGTVEGYVEERGHVFVLGLEEVSHLSGNADLVLASEFGTQSLVGDL